MFVKNVTIFAPAISNPKLSNQMKKVFLVLFASAAFSIVACKSGQKHDEMGDSTEMRNDADSAMKEVSPVPMNPPDSTNMTDTTHH